VRQSKSAITDSLRRIDRRDGTTPYQQAAWCPIDADIIRIIAQIDDLFRHNLHRGTGEPTHHRRWPRTVYQSMS
jgi:hypothetical protein